MPTSPLNTVIFFVTQGAVFALALFAIYHFFMFMTRRRRAYRRDTRVFVSMEDLLTTDKRNLPLDRLFQPSSDEKEPCVQCTLTNTLYADDLQQCSATMNRGDLTALNNENVSI